MNVAVIGAGIAGLTAARQLQRQGIKVTVFDKSKGTGGRLASRSLADGWIDHGAPYFSVDQQEFDQFLKSIVPELNLSRWSPIIKGALRDDEKVHYVGVPRNSAVTRSLLGSLEFQPSTRIARLRKSTEGWQLYNDGDSLLGCWEIIVVAVPAPQALALFGEQKKFASEIRQARMEPCWVTAVQAKEALKSLADITLDPHPAIRRITLNSAKKGRNNHHVYLIQAAKDWSERHLEASPDAVGQLLLDIFFSFIPQQIECKVLLTHRWRYAFTEKAVGRPYLWDKKLKLGACGDWCLGRRVEDAWQSGMALARAILES